MVMAPLRIAFVPNNPFSLGYAGMEVQIEQTMQALNARGHQAVPFDWWSMTLDADVVHVFGGFHHNAPIVGRLVGKGYKVVVTTMLMLSHPRWQYRFFSALHRMVNLHTSIGYRSALANSCHAVCALTNAEKDDLTQLFKVQEKRIHVVPNGVESRFFTADPEAARSRFGHRDYVLCVATIDPVKNQLGLVNAIGPTGLPLVLIGSARPSNSADIASYPLRLREAVDRFPNVQWTGGLNHDDPLLQSAYAGARVHVLASFVEGQGISSLEAAAAGASIVTSNSPAMRSAFGNDVTYCNPYQESSIQQAVKKVWENPTNHRSSPWLLSWDSVAQQLEGIYQEVLTKS